MRKDREMWLLTCIYMEGNRRKCPDSLSMPPADARSRCVAYCMYLASKAQHVGNVLIVYTSSTLHTILDPDRLELVGFLWWKW